MALSWKDDETFVLGQTTFRVLPPDAFADDRRRRRGPGFVIFKSRALLERHVKLLSELKPEHVLELGFYVGASALFIAELSHPRKVVAVDRRPHNRSIEEVEAHAARMGVGDALRFCGEVDQADRPKLAEIADEAFNGADLDLVVDDCSHLYEPTHASFNELFPRLREGGAYVIEDWRWAHVPVGSTRDEFLPDQIPLTTLLFEIVLALPSVPGLITDVSIEEELAIVRRGPARVNPSGFDISACSNPRGRALLAAE
jgi:predicted O-methyltransferase YrrM